MIDKNKLTLPKLITPLPKKIKIPFNNGTLLIEYDNKIYAPTSHSSIFAINNFTVNKGEKLAAVIGAGSGIDSMAIVKKGNLNVLATDIDPYCLAVTKYNAQLNNVENKIQLKLGNMFEPLNDYINNGKYFDVIMASPPIFPVPPKTNSFSKYLDGGSDGTEYLIIALNQAFKSLQKPNGRLYINFGSTSNPKKIFNVLNQYYRWKELTKINIPFSEQFLQIWDYLIELRKQGKSEFWEENGVPFRWYTVVEARPK